MKNNINGFIEHFSEKIINGKACFFVGSGISRSAGYKGWGEFLDDKAREIGLDVNKETDLITLAQYYVNEKNRTKINDGIKTFFDEKHGNLTETHSLICNFPLNSIWTTNYDSLLEKQLKKSNITYSVLTDDKSYRDVDNTANVIVHKVHGTYLNPNECVITKEDYENYHCTHDIVLSQLKAEMCSNSFLFIGYGLRDTDINHIFSKIRQIYDKEHPFQHYCIMKKVSKYEDGKEKNADEYLYEKYKEKYFIDDMKLYGIEVILVDDYAEIDLILKEIRKKVYSKNVLISGSSEIEDENISRLTSVLSEKLIRKGYKIMTGYGKNVGNMIVEGYFNGCFSRVTNPVTQFANAIKIIPFPFKNKSSKSKEIYSILRKNMAALTTIQVIIGGKGKKDDGTYEEYSYCSENGNLIIPIAATGGTAKIIWDEINCGIQSKEFIDLNNEFDLSSILDNVMKIIERRGL